MKLYEVLAAEYTKVFPSSREKVGFFENLLDRNIPQDVLDIGCASGEFAFQMDGSSIKITGIDLDDHMIQEAKAKRTEEQAKRLRFIKADMLDFLSATDPESFDLVCCLGNTLVYLNGEGDLKKFLRSAKKTLKEKGKLVVQVLNYSNPVIRPGFDFPPAEGRRIILERSYRQSDTPAKLDFKTRVKDKVTGEIHTDTHKHYPFLSKKIEEAAMDIGFSTVLRFGNYAGKEAESTDFFHITVIET